MTGDDYAPRPPTVAQDSGLSEPPNAAAAGSARLTGGALNAAQSSIPIEGRFGLIALAACLLWLLPGIWGRGLWKPDEAYTVGIVYHFFHSREWLIPMLGGAPFVEKPPLYFWTAAVFARLFRGLLSVNEAARFATLLYTGLALLFAWAGARELFGARRAPLASLVLIASLGLVYRGHELMTDGGLLAGLALAAWGIALSLRRPVAGGLLLGLGTGIGFLCKGLIAPGVLGLTFLLLPLVSPRYRMRRWWTTAGAALALALPMLLIWPWLVYLDSPPLFGNWLWHNNFGRFLHGDDMGNRYSPFYYLKILPWFALPAWPLALLAVWKNRSRWREPMFALPLVFAVVTYLVLQASRAVSDVYALPLLLPLAWLGAQGIGELPVNARRALNLGAWLLFGLLAAMLWWGWWVYVAGAPAGTLAFLNRLLPRGVMQFEWIGFALALLYTLLWLLLPLAARPSPERSLLRWTTGLALVWCLCMSLWLPVLNSSKSYAQVIIAVDKALPKHYNCIASWGLGDSERGMLAYYDGIDTQPFYNRRSQPDCSLLLVENSLAGGEDFPGWQPLWSGSRPQDTSDHFWLLAPAMRKAKVKLARLQPAVRRKHRSRRPAADPVRHDD